MKWGLLFEYGRKKAQLKESEENAADPALWEEGARAQEFMKKMGTLREQIRPLQGLEGRLEEIEVLLELAGENPDEGKDCLLYTSRCV